MTSHTIDSLWRFPVKSLGGEKLEQVNVNKHGILGDRAFALFDKETGKVVSAKSVKHYPTLLNCQAVYLRAPQPGQALPPVQITLADGTSVTSNSPDTDQILSRFFGRDVTLSTAAPADYTIDMYHPDVDGMDPSAHRDTFVEQKLGSALFKSMGTESPLAQDSFMDIFPISIITTATLQQLTKVQPDTDFDVRRFRMNIVVETTDTGFIENSWVGHVLDLGNKVRLRITMPDSRCVMTTLAQAELPKDINVLRTLVQHNRQDVPGLGKMPCAGVYATVDSQGTLAINESVYLRREPTGI